MAPGQPTEHRTAGTVVAAPEGGVFAVPRTVDDPGDCYFYHTMELPGLGTIEGEWDLRGSARAYLGNVELAGKRVLEVGTASGFLCFWMERQGAEVVAYDLSDEHDWDIVPFAQYDHEARVRSRREHIRKLNNAFWLAHRLLDSRAKVVYGTVYEIPAELGLVDVTTFSAVLLHLRDPFLALQRALRLTRELVVVTERVPLRYYAQLRLLGALSKPAMAFRPDFRTVRPKETWWISTPNVIREFLGVLGFEDTRVSYHFQRYHGRRRLLYTVVGRRTRPLP